MEWIDSLREWAGANEAFLWWLFAASVAVFLLTPIGVAWAVIRLPSDYFTRRRRPLGSWKTYPALRIAALAAKNMIGTGLLTAGLIMLVVPGQGLLTMAMALALLDFPGKYRLEKWIATRPNVWRSLNWLRKRLGKKPFVKPE
jgi:hypothetical protein